MRLPQIPKKPTYRVDTPTSYLMYATSGFFDLMQLVPKIFIILGIAAQVIPIIGQIVGTAAIGVEMALDLVLGVVISLAGFSTMWLWFQFKHVQVFSGNYMGRKALMLPATMMVEMMPFFNIFPSITFWTWYTIRISRKEDKEAHDTLVHKMQAEAKVLIRKERMRVQELATMQAVIQEQRMRTAAQERRSRATSDDTQRHLREQRLTA